MPTTRKKAEPAKPAPARKAATKATTKKAKPVAPVKPRTDSRGMLLDRVGMLETEGPLPATSSGGPSAPTSC